MIIIIIIIIIFWVPTALSSFLLKFEFCYGRPNESQKKKLLELTIISMVANKLRLPYTNCILQNSNSNEPVIPLPRKILSVFERLSALTKHHTITQSQIY